MMVNWSSPLPCILSIVFALFRRVIYQMFYPMLQAVTY